MTLMVVLNMVVSIKSTGDDLKIGAVVGSVHFINGQLCSRQCL